MIFTFLSRCAAHINGEIHICISLSCLRSSCKRRSSNGNARRPHSTTAHAHHDRLCRRAVRSLCGRAVVRSVFIETPKNAGFQHRTRNTACRASISRCLWQVRLNDLTNLELGIRIEICPSLLDIPCHLPGMRSKTR